jgi:hypothetical protein
MDTKWANSGTSMRIWHGLDIEWRLPNGARGDKVVDFLEEHIELFEKIAAVEPEWDGINWRVHGARSGCGHLYREDDPIHQIQGLLYNEAVHNYVNYAVWDAADWLEAVATLLNGEWVPHPIVWDWPTIEADTTDASIKKIAQEIQEVAQQDDNVLDGLEGWLANARDTFAAAEAEDLAIYNALRKATA